MKPKLNKTAQNKAKFIDALHKNLNIVSAACEATGLSRSQFYAWYREDAEFAKKVDELPEFQLDFVENALFRRIKEGSDTAITFYLKTKGRKRGYDSTVDVNVTGDISIQVIKLNENKDGITD